MTDQTLVILAAALPPTLLALGSMLTSLRTQTVAQAAKLTAEHTSHQVATVAVKVEQVHAEAAQTNIQVAKVVEVAQATNTTAAQTNTDVAKVVDKVQEVHTLTNSNYTEQKQIIVQLQTQVAGLLQDAVRAEAARQTLAAEARATSRNVPS